MFKLDLHHLDELKNLRTELSMIEAVIRLDELLDSEDFAIPI